MIDDRRKHPRLPLPVDVVWEGASGKHEARASDISVGGCFIDTIGQVAVGEIVNFTLRLPEGEAIELKGEVAYEMPRFGFGLRYVDLSEENLKRLATFIGQQE